MTQKQITIVATITADMSFQLARHILTGGSWPEHILPEQANPEQWFAQTGIYGYFIKNTKYKLSDGNGFHVGGHSSASNAIMAIVGAVSEQFKDKKEMFAIIDIWPPNGGKLLHFGILFEKLNDDTFELTAQDGKCMCDIMGEENNKDLQKPCFHNN